MYHNCKKAIYLVFFLLLLSLSACSSSRKEKAPGDDTGGADTSYYIVSVENEPDSVDFQCTTTNYTIAFTTFDRLVRIVPGEDGEITIGPSLAESWQISKDGRAYTFHLRKDVSFSNGAMLTSSDVLFTVKRLLTHPRSTNGDIVKAIKGADALSRGETTELTGFKIIDDWTFVIMLNQPYAAFLSSLATPGASIMDQGSAETAGDLFGTAPAYTIGTGPFIFDEWIPNKGMLLSANPHYWDGPPKCAGLDFRFLLDPVEQRLMFDEGKLDILDLDNLGEEMEFFIHGDIYQDNLFAANQLGISYIALNESIQPLNDVRVRKALQLALNRQTLLDTACSSRGQLENGIFPHGLAGYNPDLPEIPCDPEEARRLLAEAGLADGFSLEISLRSSSTQWQKEMMQLAASMWEQIGVHSTIVILGDSEFMSRRKSGSLACYTATWSADYDDPDNFIYTFFGTRENSIDRSLCYDNDRIITRVHDARHMINQERRFAEYSELERIIVQEDAAWIPLFSKTHYFVTSDRIQDFSVDWNGWITYTFKDMSVIK